MLATLQKNARLVSRLEIVVGLVAAALFALFPIIAFHSVGFVTLQVLKVAFLTLLAVQSYGKDTATVRWATAALVVSVVTDSAWVYR